MKKIIFLLFIVVLFVGGQIKEYKLEQSDIVNPDICKKNLSVFTERVGVVGKNEATYELFSHDLSWNNRACIIAGYKSSTTKSLYKIGGE